MCDVPADPAGRGYRMRAGPDFVSLGLRDRPADVQGLTPVEAAQPSLGRTLYGHAGWGWGCPELDLRFSKSV